MRIMYRLDQCEAGRNVGWRESETECMGRTLLSSQMGSPLSLENYILCAYKCDIFSLKISYNLIMFLGEEFSKFQEWMKYLGVYIYILIIYWNMLHN